jgi:hypothetical protein
VTLHPQREGRHLHGDVVVQQRDKLVHVEALNAST